MEFQGELFAWREDEPGSWCFIRLPRDLAEEVRQIAGPGRGFGSVRVTARIGASTWQTSLFPDAASGSFVLPVKKPVRLAERVEPGDEVSVRVELMT